MYINPEKRVRSSEDARAAHGQQFVEADSNPEPRCKLSLLSLLRLSRQSSPSQRAEAEGPCNKVLDHRYEHTNPDKSFATQAFVGVRQPAEGQNWIHVPQEHLWTETRLGSYRLGHGGDVTLRWL